MTSFYKVKTSGSVTEERRNTDNGTSYWASGPSTSPFLINTERAEGEQTPNFHRRIRDGELLPLNHYHRSSETSFGMYSYDGGRYSDGDTYHVRSRWVPEQHLDYDLPIDRSVLVQGAAARAYSKGHDTLTFLAELSKARRMLSQFPSKIIRLIRSKKVSSLGELNRLWLEGRYGWRILVYDLQDLHNLLQVVNEHQRKRVSERIGTEVNLVKLESREARQPAFYNPSLTLATYTVNTRTSVTGSIRGTVVADFEPPRMQFNPVVTAWELVPFSFIIDWLVSVGTALEAISFSVVAPEHYAAYGESISVTTQQYTSNAQPGGATHFLTSLNGEGTLQTVTKTRVPMSVPKLPRFNFNLDHYKVVDLFAIYRELTRRK